MRLEVSTVVEELFSLAEQIAERLRERGQTLAVAESSAGGLISAALLSVAGASRYFVGGAVVYTRTARSVILDIPDSALDHVRPSTEPYALLLARTARSRFGTTWAVAETGASGPTGNRYGDPAGHACIAVVGEMERAQTVRTGHDDRAANMLAFTVAALQQLLEALGGSR